MNEKDRNSCRETNLKQLEHKIEFGQPSMAYLHTQEKSTETANKFLCVEWCKVCFRSLEQRFKVTKVLSPFFCFLCRGHRERRLFFPEAGREVHNRRGSFSKGRFMTLVNILFEAEVK